MFMCSAVGSCHIPVEEVWASVERCVTRVPPQAVIISGGAITLQAALQQPAATTPARALTHMKAATHSVTPASITRSQVCSPVVAKHI